VPAQGLIGAPACPALAARREEKPMADLLFVLVTVVAFAALVAFVYACDRL
jgi:hypothetical protein